MKKKKVLFGSCIFCEDASEWFLDVSDVFCFALFRYFRYYCHAGFENKRSGKVCVRIPYWKVWEEFSLNSTDSRRFLFVCLCFSNYAGNVFNLFGGVWQTAFSKNTVLIDIVIGGISISSRPTYSGFLSIWLTRRPQLQLISGRLPVKTAGAGF